MPENKTQEGDTKANTEAETKTECARRAPRRQRTDVEIWITVFTTLTIISGAALSFLGISGSLKNRQVLGLWIFYTTVVFALTWAFLYIHKGLRQEQIKAAAAPKQELHGLLIPANEPRPIQLPERFNDYAVVLLGDSSLITKGTLTGIEVMGNKLISVTSTEAGIAISARVISPSNNVIAQITDNEFYVNPNDSFQMRRDDWHSLEVVDREGNRVLYVHYLNPTTVKVLGSFYIPGQAPTIIAEDHILTGGMEFRGMTLGADAGTAFSVNSPTPKNKNKARAKKK